MQFTTGKAIESEIQSQQSDNKYFLRIIQTPKKLVIQQTLT
jgi:hypothetical protein